MDEDDHDILIEIRQDLKHLTKWASSRPCLMHEKEILLLKSEKKWIASIVGTLLALLTAIGAFFR